MEQTLDLYTLLKTYAFKNCSPEIDLEVFIMFLEKNASREKAKAQLGEWQNDTRGKVTQGILELAEEQKISIRNEIDTKKIILKNFYFDFITRAYLSPLNTAKLPFFNEISLNLRVSENQLRIISVKNELQNYLTEYHGNPGQIIKLIFPEDYGSALTLEDQYPSKILEISLIKISEIIKQQNELEFFTPKILSFFKNVSALARDTLNTIIAKPVIYKKNIEDSGDFTFEFWQFLCPLITNHIKEKTERSGVKTNEDLAFGQSASLIYAFNTYYQIIAAEKKEKEMAFGLVYNMAGEPPYMYTINDMMGFANNSGSRILESYKLKDLEEFLKTKMAVSNKDVVPYLLKFKTRIGNDIYVRKENVLPLCIKLLADARFSLKKIIQTRWEKALKSFRREAAMDDDEKFERLLLRTCSLENSVTMDIIQDKRVALIEAETPEAGKMKSKGVKIYQGFQLLPMRTLLALNRREILRDARCSLPFWYSVGILVSIARFLKYGFKKDDDDYDEETLNVAKTAELQELIKKMMAKLVPKNTTIDAYMTSVRDRWNQLIKKQDNKRLTSDVHEIIKTNLSHALKIYNVNNLNEKVLDNIAESIMHSNIYTFQTIRDKKSLHLYVRLYIVKLLKAR